MSKIKKPLNGLCSAHGRLFQRSVMSGGDKVPSVKTAISLEESLFNQVNKLADDLHISRSKLFTIAVKEYLKKQEWKKILAQLNAAYGDSATKKEDAISKAMQKKQHKIVEHESW